MSRFSLVHCPSLEQVKEAYQLDLAAYGQEALVPLDQVLSWYQRDSDIIALVWDLEQDKITGYVTTIPVTDRFFESFSRGTVKETDLTPDMILEESDSLYFCSLVVQEAYRTSHGVLRLLYQEIKSRLGKATRVVAWAATAPGLRLVQRHSFREVSPNIYVFNKPGS